MSAQQSTCKARALRAASHPGSTITSRKKNKEIHRYCPGVSLHVTPHPVFKNLTIPGAYHILSCMERESISLTCATLDFPAKYSWNLKTSLRCFHEICQQIKVLVYKKWKKHLWNWNTGLPPELHHETGTVLQAMQGPPVHLLVYGAHVHGSQESSVWLS